MSETLPDILTSEIDEMQEAVYFVQWVNIYGLEVVTQIKPIDEFLVFSRKVNDFKNS